MLRDAALVSLSFVACLVAGFVINFLRPDPLPLTYKSRAERRAAASPIPTVSLAEITSADRKQDAAFTVFYAAAWLCGLDVSCSCFGSINFLRVSTTGGLVRAVLLLALAAWVMREEDRCGA